jgi:hypothetical protein
VWTAGNNVNGVAGIGTTGTNLTSLHSLTSLGANFITKIYARDQDTGGIVAAVTTSTGKVFFSGYNGYGQMGSNDTTNRGSYFEPTVASGAFQNKVSKVALGGSGWGSGLLWLYIYPNNRW